MCVVWYMSVVVVVVAVLFVAAAVVGDGASMLGDVVFDEEKEDKFTGSFRVVRFDHQGLSYNGAHPLGARRGGFKFLRIAEHF